MLLRCILRRYRSRKDELLKFPAKSFSELYAALHMRMRCTGAPPAKMGVVRAQVQTSSHCCLGRQTVVLAAKHGWGRIWSTTLFRQEHEPTDRSTDSRERHGFHQSHNREGTSITCSELEKALTEGSTGPKRPRNSCINRNVCTKPLAAKPASYITSGLACTTTLSVTLPTTSTTYARVRAVYISYWCTYVSLSYTVSTCIFSLPTGQGGSVTERLSCI